MSTTLYTTPIQTIDGKDSTLSQFQGEVLLIVNVASKCGLTPQYEGLEKLQQQHQGQQFSVLGFPANDFGDQEPGDNQEIQRFCSTNYNVQFPLFSKIVVTGVDKHPLYAQLISSFPTTAGREAMEQMLKGYNIEPTQAPEVVWNFEKFLISRTGQVVGRFAPNTAPDDAALVAAIEAELAK